LQIVRAILWGLWRGLDVLRKFLHLITLLVVFGFVFGALRVSLPVVPAKAALLVAPEGQLVEQMSAGAGSPGGSRTRSTRNSFVGRG
jgi:hypothetical protein